MKEKNEGEVNFDDSVRGIVNGNGDYIAAPFCFGADKIGRQASKWGRSM